MATNPVPAWFNQIIGEGLARLRLVGFDGTPAADTVKATAKVWAEAFWSTPKAWDEEQDRARLREAFVEAARRCERWPVPKQVLGFLSPRPEPLQLAAPQMSEAQRLANKARIREVLGKLVRH